MAKILPFFVTNYATKDQLSTHNMVPLIAASKKGLDEDSSIASNDQKSRAKAMITKCLNKITTETEISGAHVSHFLLGHKDNKTSHKFTSLNLHSALIWLANAIKEYDSIDDDDLTNVDNGHNVVDLPNSANEHDNDDDDDNEDENATYTLTTGNDGLVLIDQMTDYINRGQALKNMCFWEYRSKVYKKKFTEEELKKREQKADAKKSGRECEQTHPFTSNHPQSETHWQRVRIKRGAMIPTLSLIPPSSDTNQLKFQKCMLLLFKPFSTFQELYNGISWDDTYSEFLETEENKRYVENMDDFLNNMDEAFEENDEDDGQLRDEIMDGECDNDISQSDETDDTGLDSLTTEALDVIRNTP